MRFAAAVSAAVTSVVCLLGAGQATAALEDRGDDPVVVEGTGLPDLLGARPERIVGFRWAGGKWDQIPVQVDERHTINARQLYPDNPGSNPYIGPTTLGFELEVYADEETRSGADANTGFDEDDELVFMGGDSGDAAPNNAAAPEGVDGDSGVRVVANDPIGGDSGFVYLFRSAGKLDPAAGEDYVQYDFKLTDLGPGETLRDDYGYIHSSNPEDSTVSTDSYELHSFDRWMEDEMKVKAGSASGVDILDREVAQAGKTGCGRTEYTFSGRWTEDTWPDNNGNTDDEGTYVAVKDGPVRALRSYMGANSGPYVQREHVYYRAHEENTIFLRVHIMADLYSWTDYAPAAIGMTYRDAKNPEGVPVDGTPDTLVPTTSADVANGAYSWQQLSGEQGSVSTVVGAQTDIPNPNFGNYYLDDETPDDPDELQCGGDEQSIGASGFGILGPITPNTDPRQAVFNNLTVERIRFFGPPSDGAVEAAGYASRVGQPLAAEAEAAPLAGAPKLKVKRGGKKMRKARSGEPYKAKVLVENKSSVAAKPVEVCVKGRALKGVACKELKSLGAGKSKVVGVKTTVKRKAKGKKLKLKAIVRSGKTKVTKKISVPLKD